MGRDRPVRSSQSISASDERIDSGDEQPPRAAKEGGAGVYHSGMVQLTNTTRVHLTSKDCAAWSPTLVRGEMKYWLLRPEESLREDVKCYFVVEAAARRVCKEELHLPDGYAELVFVFCGSFDRYSIERPTNANVMSHSYVIGARSRTVLTRDMGDLRVIGVKLESRLLRQLIRMPLSALRDSTISFAELNNKALLELEARIAECHNVQEISYTLNRFLSRYHRSVTTPDPVVDHFIARVRAARGMLSIAQCAREYGIDPRTLERRFSAWVGMSPKAYARIVRFKHAYHAVLNQCRRGGTFSKAVVHQSRGRFRHDDALDGYYDESHFYKEFRFFTGSSPTRLIAPRAPTSTDVTNHLLSEDLAIASA